MSDIRSTTVRVNRFDRPSESITAKNLRDAPWHDETAGTAKVASQHRQYHSLFEDLMN